MTSPALLDAAAAAIRAASALVFTAGAGMGVDSGLPDFRGDEGFWKAYPPLRTLGLSFAQMANPSWFRVEPALAWGFYGHRLMLYRRTAPHPGFAILQRWARRAPRGAFVFTSNVDGHFQRAGWDPERIEEVHGALEVLQCTRSCGAGLWSAADTRVDVDETTFRAREPLPRCPGCGALARPNVLMFGDGDWDDRRSAAQHARLEAWLGTLSRADRLVVVECGAGLAIPTVRYQGEELAERFRGRLVRVNPRDEEVPTGHLGLALGARAGLEALDQRLSAEA